MAATLLPVGAEEGGFDYRRFAELIAKKTTSFTPFSISLVKSSSFLVQRRGPRANDLESAGSRCRLFLTSSLNSGENRRCHN
jgi:hypothetical protein